MKRPRIQSLRPVGVGVLIAAVVIGIQLFGPMSARNRHRAQLSQSGVLISSPVFGGERIENRESFHRLDFASPIAASAEALFRKPSAPINPPGSRLAAAEPQTQTDESAALRVSRPRRAAEPN